MPIFTTIVWATDGSPHADRALALATRIARETGAPLHVVHVVEKLVGGRATGLDSRVDQEDVYARVQAEVRRLSDDGVRASVHLPHAHAGDAATRIADVAREVGADLIVVGTRGHSVLTGVMLGSVTQRLLHVAPCAVLAVPPVPTPEMATDTASDAIPAAS